MREKIVVFTGAGISAESGLRTFREMGGYWEEFPIEEVASPEGWRDNPEKVLQFYNERRKGVIEAQPNQAHQALVRLEEFFEVVIVTQNIDDLHERAGSTTVVHLHGEIRQARSSLDPSRVYPIAGTSLTIGECCPLGSQLRPHVVWFGEEVLQIYDAVRHFKQANRVLVVGTSLTVYPAAGLVHKATRATERLLVVPEAEAIPAGYRLYQGKATEQVPQIVAGWIARA